MSWQCMSLLVRRDGHLVALETCNVLLREGDAKLVETEDAKKVITLECDQTAVRDIVFDPMGEYVATASASGMARVFEINGTRVYEESLIEKTDVAT
ncbi:hypothetical protein SARC_10721 [Sphaeroforma arctica JP610]|uniref:Uncharacterized protein n=1 Tax=Sphaeroforma arctica JP610 TaxID=667725 RepID=A0A0L0FJ38_9EUKA|nr:hypothetical protein SARC_10721 [Sphaeroforma arctica JP610]KNC76799.1 hypothetical protein SARC_10721 [Sphaeroforma arctica JP610]|eukprot:XP_014150701.1 hypothetical protein SARC_10721 [Sphaeroforma arctica JP610]